jgi:methionine--tRNA ligase beta chain
MPIATIRYASTTDISPDSTTSPASPPPSTPAKVDANAKLSEISLLEIRTGKIVEISKHPEADSLYVEKVDVGESTGPRTIVSGLVQYCSIDSLLNKNVIVLCNLKPRPLKGITSFGMLLCASNEDHTQVVPLSPPDNVPIGELITFEGHSSAPAEAGNRASKAFSKVADDFFVDENLVATYKGIPFNTSQGIIKTTLKGKIS